MAETNARRTAELGQIHVAKKQLGLDDDTYRAMLWTVARVTSSKDLDEAGRRAVLDHMKARGFKPRPPKRGFPGRPANVDGSPQLRKVEALLASGHKPWSYADAMAKRMFSVDKVGWCNEDQLHRLIGALMVDQVRHERGARR